MKSDAKPIAIFKGVVYSLINKMKVGDIAELENEENLKEAG